MRTGSLLRDWMLMARYWGVIVMIFALEAQVVVA